MLGCGPMPQPNPTVDAGADFAFNDPVIVDRLIDGDTLEVRRNDTRFRVRIKGINCPEMNFAEPGRDPEPYAQDAVDYVVSRLGVQVGLEWDSACADPYARCQEGVDGQACFDRYCRKLAYVRLADGGDLGEELLEQGLARMYRFANERFDRLGAYLLAEDEARQNQRGLWQ